MMGIDVDYAMHRRYVFHGFDSDPQLAVLRRCLEGLLAKQPAPPEPKALLEGGIAFPADVLAARQARRDRSPRLAFDAAGAPHVIFYSNRDGTNAVYLRRFNQRGEPTDDVRLSPAGEESYCADCAFDPAGTLWTVWCGRKNPKNFYDIFVHSRRPTGESAIQQITSCDDDAMSPKIAAGPDGTVVAAYYEWAYLWGYSRDRNIFARTYQPSSRAWTKAVEVSPHFPEVEDHTDPDVVVDAQGKAWIVWSYDYHPQLYKNPVDADQPTIFAARLSANTVSSPILVGATGPFREAIDLFPSAALDTQGALWCAWDCSEPHRCIRLARLDQPANAFKLIVTFGAAQEVCSTPELSPAAQGQLLLAWSQRTRAQRWQVMLRLLKEGRPTAQAAFTDDADLLFPQPMMDPAGQYWLVYEKSNPKGSEIVLRNVTAELKAP